MYEPFRFRPRLFGAPFRADARKAGCRHGHDAAKSRSAQPRGHRRLDLRRRERRPRHRPAARRRRKPSRFDPTVERRAVRFSVISAKCLPKHRSSRASSICRRSESMATMTAPGSTRKRRRATSTSAAATGSRRKTPGRLLPPQTATDLHILRLAGIYGPGQNALVNLRDGTARRIVKPGQIFNRIHVEDIAARLSRRHSTRTSKADSGTSPTTSRRRPRMSSLTRRRSWASRPPPGNPVRRGQSLADGAQLLRRIETRFECGNERKARGDTGFPDLSRGIAGFVHQRRGAIALALRVLMVRKYQNKDYQDSIARA